MEQKQTSCTIVVFGYAGDLGQKKICPALDALKKKYNLKIVGIDLSEKKTNCIDFTFTGDLKTSKPYKELKEILNFQDSVIFYCSVPYFLYADITKELSKFDLLKPTGNNFRRIVFEKPYGNSEKTANEIDDKILSLVSKKQIYRVDHYLAQPIVSNIVYTRFTNRVIESVWNCLEIESILVVLSEKEGILDRASYYDKVGVINDVFQNHILQLVALSLMSEPESIDPETIEKLKINILKKLSIKKISLGQYKSYQHENGVARNSKTPTFMAAILECKAYCWSNVPIIVWTGKKLAQKKSFIKINFKETKCRITDQCPTPTNNLIINISPNEGFELTINAQKDLLNKVEPISLIHKSIEFNPYSIKAYINIFEDIISNNRVLAVTSQEINLSWQISDQASKMAQELYIYDDNSLGSKEAIKMIEEFTEFSELKKDLE